MQWSEQLQVSSSTHILVVYTLCKTLNVHPFGPVSKLVVMPPSLNQEPCCSVVCCFNVNDIGFDVGIMLNCC